jgi:fatty acid desaturase
MGRRSTLEEFMLPGSEANLTMISIAAGGLVLASLVVYVLPWWTLAVAGVAAGTAACFMRDR